MFSVPPVRTILPVKLLLVVVRYNVPEPALVKVAEPVSAPVPPRV